MPLRLHGKPALKSQQELRLASLLRSLQASPQCWMHALQLTLPLPQQAQTSCPVKRQVPCWTLRETDSHRV